MVVERVDGCGYMLMFDLCNIRSVVAVAAAAAAKWIEVDLNA